MQYPMIAQPQYGFAPTMPMMPSMSDMPPGMMGQNMPQMNFKEGGIASLPKMAERVQDAGRDGDTVLAHITPEEAGILQLLGGSGTINPKTGLQEFKFLKKFIPKPIYRLGSKVGKEIERGVESIAKDEVLGPIAQIAAAAFGGPIGAALYAGLAPEGSSFNTKRALTAAALTAGANYIANPGGNPLTPAYGPFSGGDATGTPSFGADVGEVPGVTTTSGDLPTVAQTAATQTEAVSPSVVESVSSAATPAASSGVGSLPIDYAGEVGASPATVTQSINPATGLPAPPPPPTFMESATKYVSEIPSKLSEGIKSLPEKTLEFAKDLPGDVVDYVLDPKNIPTNLFIGTQVKAGMEAKKELDNQKEEAERILAAQEKHTQEEIAFAQDVLRRYPVEYRRLTAEDIKSQNFAGGGLAGLNAFKAGGGPRFLKGGGDGMSDDIPAMIGKQQKAALSDGEFVVPADVVSHLGNGSSRAGAKKLYSMMDNIRQARTGKKRQAPEVKPDRYMPA
jgi:hypothetical protein